MSYVMPRVVISGLSGGSGKTIISTGLSRAFSRRGYKVQAFKKGPDYIDTLWLSLATGYPPRNLDPFMTPTGLLPQLFQQACAASQAAPDLVIIEGNRGLFDGQDLAGSCSTAELARQLSAPVLLAMNCTKMTRTAAALALGCKNFEPDLNLAGVILNRASRSRHRALVKEAVETLAGLPVLGMLPRLEEAPFDERYSGLYGDEAAIAGSAAHARLDKIADFIEEHINLDEVLRIARSAPPLQVNGHYTPHLQANAGYASPLQANSGYAASLQATAGSAKFLQTNAPSPGFFSQHVETSQFSAQAALAKIDGSRPRIGYVRDSILWFYYTENLEALRAAGADLIPLSLVGGTPWPRLDGLYLGGGFPDDFAAELSANIARRAEVTALVESGLPTYAEGSGFYYLARSLKVHDQEYPMCGIFDFSVSLGKVPQGIGYVQAQIERSNPFHPVGRSIRAHEFHYTNTGLPPALAEATLMRMDKGFGLIRTSGHSGRDGLLKHNCFISHLQLYAPGAPHWAPNFVKAAVTWADTGRCDAITAEE